MIKCSFFKKYFCFDVISKICKPIVLNYYMLQKAYYWAILRKKSREQTQQSSCSRQYSSRILLFQKIINSQIAAEPLKFHWRYMWVKWIGTAVLYLETTGDLSIALHHGVYLWIVTTRLYYNSMIFQSVITAKCQTRSTVP